MKSHLKLTDVDRRIWENELENFVPHRIFDAHTHVYKWQFNTDPHKSPANWKNIAKKFPVSDKKKLDECDSLLLPRRQIHRLSFGMPFAPSCDFQASNEFAAQQVQNDKPSAALMLVEPGMNTELIDSRIDKFGFVGFKPYRSFSITGDSNECRITDFLPEHQIKIAHRRKLIITMHLSRRNAVTDHKNINDLTSLSQKYPNAKWILAHCGRSYSAWAIENAAEKIAKLKNVWFDTSSVCETDAFDALFSAVGINRVMYGSDNLPVGALRGKYITFAYAWAYLGDENHSLDLSHCNPKMTFTLYEQLRAMKRASDRLNINEKQRHNLFYNTAANLVESARK